MTTLRNKIWTNNLVIALAACASSYMAQAACATPYTFEESPGSKVQNNLKNYSNRPTPWASVNNSGLPAALNNADEADAPENSIRNAVPNSSSFMKEDNTDPKQFFRDGGSGGAKISNHTEQWSGNKKKGNRQYEYNYGSGNSSDFKNSNPNTFAMGNRNFNRYLDPANNLPGNFNRVNAAQRENSSFKQPDQFTDNPAVDADGVRHFANGKHLDLSKMSLSDAISSTNASQLGMNQKKRNKFIGNGQDLSSAQGMTNDNFGMQRRMPYQAPNDSPLRQFVKQQRAYRDSMNNNNSYNGNGSGGGYGHGNGNGNRDKDWNGNGNGSKNGSVNGRYFDYLRVQP